MCLSDGVMQLVCRTRTFTCYLGPELNDWVTDMQNCIDLLNGLELKPAGKSSLSGQTAPSKSTVHASSVSPARGPAAKGDNFTSFTDRDFESVHVNFDSGVKLSGIKGTTISTTGTSSPAPDSGKRKKSKHEEDSSVPTLSPPPRRNSTLSQIPIGSPTNTNGSSTSQSTTSFNDSGFIDFSTFLQPAPAQTVQQTPPPVSSPSSNTSNTSTSSVTSLERDLLGFNFTPVSPPPAANPYQTMSPPPNNGMYGGFSAPMQPIQPVVQQPIQPVVQQPAPAQYNNPFLMPTQPAFQPSPTPQSTSPYSMNTQTQPMQPTQPNNYPFGTQPAPNPQNDPFAALFK